jgi:hypothetical protein
MAKSGKRGFGRIDIEATALKDQPEILDIIQPVLSRLIAWDNANEIFKLVGLDSDGRLLVSSGSTKTKTFNESDPSIGTSAVSILAENNNRKQYLIQNVSDTDIYIGFTSSVTTSLGYKLVPDATFGDDVYLGAIYAITSVASKSLRVIEWV